MTESVMLYSIVSCKPIKKAIFRLIRHRVNFRFYDYRKQGLEHTQPGQWVLKLGRKIPIYIRGTTRCRPSEQFQSSLIGNSTLDLMPEIPATIKQPLLESNGVQLIGFSKLYYSEIFNH